MTLAEAVESFLFHCQFEKHLSPKTLRAYSTDLRQFTSFPRDSGIAADISLLGKTELRPYIQSLFGRFQGKTVKRKVATLKALFRYLERDEMIVTNPFHRMDVRIKEATRLPRTIPIGQLRLLFNHLRNGVEAASPDVPGRGRLVRDLAILEMMFATGARVSEVCNLNLCDLDTLEGWVRIFGKGARERLVQLCHPVTIASLREHERIRGTAGPEEPLFLSARGTRLTEQSVRVLLRRYAKAAGVQSPVRPHLVRHSVATLLLEQGVDIRQIQFLLGHSSIATTQIYTHVDSRSQRAVLSSSHPRLLL